MTKNDRVEIKMLVFKCKGLGGSVWEVRRVTVTCFAYTVLLLDGGS